MKTHLTAISPQHSLETRLIIPTSTAPEIASAREIGEKLRSYRKEHKLSVDQCARLLKKTSKEIVDLELGRAFFIYSEMAMEVVENRYGTSPIGVKKFRDRHGENKK